MVSFKGIHYHKWLMIFGTNHLTEESMCILCQMCNRSLVTRISLSLYMFEVRSTTSLPYRSSSWGYFFWARRIEEEKVIFQNKKKPSHFCHLFVRSFTLSRDQWDGINKIGSILIANMDFSENKSFIMWICSILFLQIGIWIIC